MVLILFATRTLGLSEQAMGLCYMGMGLGTLLGSGWAIGSASASGPGPAC